MSVLLVSCGSKPPPDAGPRQPKPPAPERTVHSGSGEATRRSEEAGRGKEWTVKWKSAVLDVGSDGAIGGSMEGVVGVLYRDDKPASDFSADRADADRATGVLVLSGRVRVAAREGGTVLTCQSLTWRVDDRVAAARGDVRVESPDWTLGPAPEIWANADLTRAGTPEAYAQGGER